MKAQCALKPLMGLKIVQRFCKKRSRASGIRRDARERWLLQAVDLRKLLFEIIRIVRRVELRARRTLE